MTRIFVRHNVADYDAWRRGYDAFDSKRRDMGATSHEVWCAVDDPRDVTVSHDFATPEAARAFADSPELREAMRNAGVEGQPTVWFVERR